MFKGKRWVIYVSILTVFSAILSMTYSKNIVRPINAESSISSFYELRFNDINGDPIKLDNYKGKKIMIVNVASNCGYTSQYEGLQALYEEYNDKLEIIAIPCNDFGSQEPGNPSEIKNFCEINYGVTFTVGSKQNIKSSPISGLYEWLSNPELNGWNKKMPSWNFCKYIIDEKGQLTHFLKSGVKPGSKNMRNIIKS